MTFSGCNRMSMTEEVLVEVSEKDIIYDNIALKNLDENEEGIYIIVDRSNNSEVYKKLYLFSEGTKVKVLVKHYSNDNGETWHSTSVIGIVGN